MAEGTPDDIEQAIGWASWTVQNTDMGFRRVLRRASNKFGATQADVERGVRSELGDEFLHQRGERLRRKYAPQEVKESMKRKGRLYRDAKAGERHIFDIVKGRS